MFFLYGLPPSLSVLIIEKGGFLTHEDRLISKEIRPDPVPQTNFSAKGKAWIKNAVFGGNSLCWWGQVPRFHPDDFRLRSRFDVAQDWLLSYNDLEPHYEIAEHLMEVAGGGSDHVLPRNRPFPFPPHAPSRSDQTFQQTDPLWVSSPAARSNGGRRANCCANGICSRCPVDAKYSILNGIEDFERAGAFLLLETEARAIRIEGGKATGVLVRGASGEQEFNGSLIGLGANAIFNPAILLRSGFKAPAMGCYLHEQASYLVEIDAPIKNFFGGTSITGLGYHFYHEADRDKRAAVLIENHNVPAAIRPERSRWTERLTLKLIAEDLPQAQNRVVLDGDEAHIEWYGHASYCYDGLEHAKSNLDRVIPVDIEKIEFLKESVTEAHIQGTTRMGQTIEDGVVDRTLKCHEAQNVLCLGSGVFPTCSPANPTLTLAALSLYAASNL